MPSCRRRFSTNRSVAAAGRRSDERNTAKPRWRYGGRRKPHGPRRRSADSRPGSDRTLSDLITLDTYITAVANFIRWENLEDFVLVGHSYGGWIISGVAEQVEGKISSIVFLDAFMPKNEQRVLDTNSPRSRAEIEQAQTCLVRNMRD